MAWVIVFTFFGLLQLAVLLPVATLCYLVKFFTFKAAVDWVLFLNVDIIAVVNYI